MIFLKLGGSLITDKTQPETVRHDVLARIAAEIAAAYADNPTLKLLIGHGSGSFGHVAAAKYGTRHGVRTAAQWRGFAEVKDAAARLNSLVRDSLRQAGLPVVSFAPSNSADCENGILFKLATEPIKQALEVGLMPLIFGDVAFDRALGGTIVSTEELFAFLVETFRPQHMLLAGETDGVYDTRGDTVPLITKATFPSLTSALGGSRGTDVTGGMAAKVRDMVDLTVRYPDLTVTIFSGLDAGNLHTALAGHTMGTKIRAN